MTRRSPFWSGTLGRTLALLVLTPGLALAHGKLLRATPAAGSRTARAPRELTLTFSEKIEVAVARVRLLGANAKPIALGAPAAADGGRTIRASIPATLGAGTYTVAWRVSGRDGHPVGGTFQFTVGGAANGASQAEAPAAGGGHEGHAAHAGPTRRSPETR
jgi:methionine-rich copper-binding protein CopC